MADNKMKMKMNSDLHVAMFPWLAFGHFIPYLHLSNKLAERGIKISFLLPKGVIPKMAKLNRFPDLIHFFPLTIPHIEGLPLGAETLSDIPISLQGLICKALDQTTDQVRAVLGTISTDIVIFDFAFWVPCLGRELGFKSVRYSIVCAALPALILVPCEEMTIGGAKLVKKMQEEPSFRPVCDKSNSEAEISFYERLHIGVKESDALAVRTCYEIEAPFVDHLSQRFSKPVMLTGPLLPEKAEGQGPPLDENLEEWLNKFRPGSVVFCAFGSQNMLQKDQFQELIMGFELCGMPFLAALTPPKDCLTVEEAMPEGFKERVQRRGKVYGGWVPQQRILNHLSIGCFVSHGGSSSMWESLASSCQIVLVPPNFDHVVHTMLMVEELKVAVEVKREKNGWVSKEGLTNAIISAMNMDSELAMTMKINHAKWRKFLLDKEVQETYIDTLVKNLHDLV